MSTLIKAKDISAMFHKISKIENYIFKNIYKLLSIIFISLILNLILLKYISSSFILSLLKDYVKLIIKIKRKLFILHIT